MGAFILAASNRVPIKIGFYKGNEGKVSEAEVLDANVVEQTSNNDVSRLVLSYLTWAPLSWLHQNAGCLAHNKNRGAQRCVATAMDKIYRKVNDHKVQWS